MRASNMYVNISHAWILITVIFKVAWLDLSLLFATDKWMFTHIYKKPPQYDGALARLGAAVLPFAVPIPTGPFWN